MSYRLQAQREHSGRLYIHVSRDGMDAKTLPVSEEAAERLLDELMRAGVKSIGEHRMLPDSFEPDGDYID